MADIDFDLSYKGIYDSSILIDEFGDSIIYKYNRHDKYLIIKKKDSPKLIGFINEFVKDNEFTTLEKQIVLSHILRKYKHYSENSVIVDISKKDIFRRDENVEICLDKNEVHTSWTLYYQFNINVVSMLTIPNGIKLLLNNINRAVELEQQYLENITHISVISNIKSETLV